MNGIVASAGKVGSATVNTRTNKIADGDRRLFELYSSKVNRDVMTSSDIGTSTGRVYSAVINVRTQRTATKSHPRATCAITKKATSCGAGASTTRSLDCGANPAKVKTDVSDIRMNDPASSATNTSSRLTPGTISSFMDR